MGKPASIKEDSVCGPERVLAFENAKVIDIVNSTGQRE